MTSIGRVECREHLDLDGVQIYSEMTGAGPPVLLLHGGFSTLETLRPQAEALAVDHRVHAYERPGHGRSPDTAGAYSYHRGVAQALAYLDVRAERCVDVVGYSDGAVIGLLLALHHPERVNRLISISGNLDPTGFADSGSADIPQLPHLPATEEADDSPWVERVRYDALSPDGPAHGDVVLAKLYHLWRNEPQITADQLARVGTRTLVMSGDRDSIRVDHSC